MGDLKLNFFFNLNGHTDSPRHVRQRRVSQQGSRPSRSKIGDRIATEQLAHCHPIHLFFVDSMVPVVQRKERGFPKTKPAFHHTSSAVVSTTQTAFCYYFALEASSSQVIRNLPIFMQPGDTKGDTKLSTVLVRSRLRRLICPLSWARPTRRAFGSADR